MCSGNSSSRTQKYNKKAAVFLRNICEQNQMRNTIHEKKNHSQLTTLGCNIYLGNLNAVRFVFGAASSRLSRTKKKYEETKQDWKNMKAHEWLASSGYYFFLHYHISLMQLPAMSWGIFPISSLFYCRVLLFVVLSTGTSDFCFFIVIYLNARARSSESQSERRGFANIVRSRCAPNINHLVF